MSSNQESAARRPGALAEKSRKRGKRGKSKGKKRLLSREGRNPLFGKNGMPRLLLGPTGRGTTRHLLMPRSHWYQTEKEKIYRRANRQSFRLLEKCHRGGCDVVTLALAPSHRQRARKRRKTSLPGEGADSRGIWRSFHSRRGETNMS